MESEGMAEVSLRAIRARGKDRYTVTLATSHGDAYDFEFRRVPAPYGGHDTQAPDDLQFPEGSMSSMGTFLYRVVGLFRAAATAAQVPLTGLTSDDPAGPLTLLYHNGDGSTAELAFSLPHELDTPGRVQVSDEDAERAAVIGLDAETVGRMLYPFAMQLRQPIEILVPEAGAGTPPDGASETLE